MGLQPTFTGFDIAVVAVVLISAVAAYARGFVREAFSLLAWAGACAATVYLFDIVRPYARAVIPIEMFADVGAAVAIFVVTLVVLSLLATNITRAVANSGHGALDRSVGFLFGLIRGALLVCAGYVVISWMVSPGEQPGWMREARTMPLVREGAAEIQRLLPADIATGGRDAAQTADQRVRQAAEAERLFRGLSTPAPQTAPAESAGYRDQERRKLDELIRGAQ